MLAGTNCIKLSPDPSNCLGVCATCWQAHITSLSPVVLLVAEGLHYMVAGTMAPAGRALRAGLKEAAGKLVAQLYDRNSRRQFVPPEAFQTDSLPPERFQVEMQTVAAGAGGVMEASKSRVWGLLRHVTTLHAHTLLDFCCAVLSVVAVGYPQYRLWFSLILLLGNIVHVLVSSVFEWSLA